MSTTKTRAADVATNVVEETLAATRSTVETAVKAGQDAVQKNLETAFAMTKDQFEKVGGTMFKGFDFDDAAAYGKDNIDAVVTAGNIATKGWQDLGTAWFAFAKGAADNNVANMKALMAVKTPQDLLNIQSTFAKSTFDNFVAEGSKLSEMGVKVTNEALAPINARVNATVEKLAKPLAA